MRTITGLSLLLLLLLSLPISGHATAYFAEAAGSDSNNCTSGAKCQSFHRLVNRSLTAGDTLGLKCGEVYREAQSSVTPPTNGTSSSPITLHAYGTCYSQKGVHEGAANAANLTDVGVNFSTLGVLPGHRLFNLTKGANCYVSNITTTTTTNDTLVCSMGIAHDLDVDWDVGDRYLVDNRPIVTHTDVLGSWSHVGNNVWSATITKHAGRQVWINGKSTLAMLHDSTCSASGMAGAEDVDFCVICDSGTSRGCGPAKVYIKSNGSGTGNNPANRWTNPGVEVVHRFDSGVTLFDLGARTNWIVQDVALEKVYGTIVVATGSNVQFTNVRLGYPQRKNCGCAGDNTADSCPAAGTCTGGINYPWLYGQDDRGSEAIKVSAAGTNTITGSLLTGLLVHDCENNCLSYSGTGNITSTLSDSEFFNNAHSAINTGLSSSSGSAVKRTITIRRLIAHGVAVAIHSSGTGPKHNFTMSDSYIYDLTETGDPRQIRPSGQDDPYNIYLEDPGTYTLERNISIEGGHGVFLAEGTHILRNNIMQANNTSGVNAKNTSTRVQLQNNILADNGTGTVDVGDAQVGCIFTPCSTEQYRNTASNNNKFRQPSGTDFGYLGGPDGDTSMSLAEWQSMTGGDGTSTTTDDCFVNAAGHDFNFATGCNDISAGRGIFRDLTIASGTLQGTSIFLAATVGGTAPISKCDASKLTVEYNNVAQTITGCQATQPLSNTVVLTLAQAAPAGALVEVRGTYGALEDSQRVGGVLNAKSRAFSDIALTNSAQGCLVGSSRAVPAGTDRVLLVMHGWEKQNPVSPPLAFTSCTYGGQNMTHVGTATVTDGAGLYTLADAWFLAETGIAAATSTAIACTPDETIDGPRPIVTISCPFTNINQVTPILDSEATTHPTAASITSALLSTSTPGVAVQVAVAGNAGSWAPGSGWVEHLDVAEDTDPGTSVQVATRETTGSDITGSATFTPAQTFSNRLSLLTVTLNGGTGGVPPAATASLRQTGSRCFQHNEAGFVWTTPQNTACRLVSGYSLAIVSEYLNEGGPESFPVGKQLQCCTTADCTADSAWVAVDNTGANGVRYLGLGPTISTPASFTHGTPLPNRLLTGPAMTYIPGALHTVDSMIATPALATGEGSDVGHAITITVPAPATVQCRLARDNNQPLEAYDAAAITTITVLPGAASGL